MQKKGKLFKRLNDFFDKIYVINLERSKERRVLIEQRLDGLEFQFHKAVDAKELDLNELQENGLYHSQICRILKKRRGVRAVDMPLQRIACALSHKSVIERAKKEGLDRVLILEDDVDLVASKSGSLASAFSELPSNWDFLYLGHFGANSNPSKLLKFQSRLLSNFAKVFSRRERMRVINPDIIDGWFPKKYSEHLDISGRHYGNHAYGLSKAGILKLSGYLSPIVQEIDNMCGELCSYRWLNAYNLRSQIFFQDGEIPSTIDVSSNSQD